MLAVTVAGIHMKTPVIAASGTFGFGLEYKDFIDLNEIGAIAVKGLTLEARSGNQGRRIAETPSGMLNSIGLENPGVDAFLATILPQLKQYDVPVIANISGNTVEEYALMAKKLTVAGVAGLEVNISCPNVKNGCLAFGVDPESAALVTRAVKNNTSLPVIVKLSPNVTDIVTVAKAVEAAGADAVSLINTLLGMAIDIHSWRPVLGNVVGGLSGPAVKPVALRMVWQVAKAVTVPVIGMGGIMTAEDALEFMLAGAAAVSVGTASLVNPRAAADIAQGMQEYLQKKNLQHINDIVGKLQ
ncbi:dihydroorotate dehydrogenase (NAD+) catalytic subunit [Anaerospora hongkongensis]|uniref:Dihydroorotate dehydrogenase n=1 Tax=Anaerospora hongkongensis TaxID=244830 RepID=A0A4R1PNN5_9FIRM|nr:dihydroorotate dehydrogenase [Anaerospora hongkongensis]TCL32982.1 dihydroorotate dehydrogenase (NAD+) catalytic subunit [Anaerospora hongkongensis]